MNPVLKLVIATYNICHGAKVDQITQNIHHLNEQGVQLFYLQEVRKTKGSKDFIGTILKQKFGKLWQAEYFLANEVSNNDCGLGLLWNTSVLRLVSSEQLILPQLSKLNVWEKVFEKYAVHRMQPIRRGALIATFTLNGMTVRVTNLHLDWQGGPRQRLRQLEHVVSHLQTKPDTDHEIIGGDFNTLGPTRLKKQQEWIQKILGYNFKDSSPDVAWTALLDRAERKGVANGMQNLLVAMGMRFPQRLDYIYVKGFTVIKANVIDMAGSDHLPLIAILTP